MNRWWLGVVGWEDVDGLESGQRAARIGLERREVLEFCFW